MIPLNLEYKRIGNAKVSPNRKLEIVKFRKFFWYGIKSGLVVNRKEVNG